MTTEARSAEGCSAPCRVSPEGRRGVLDGPVAIAVEHTTVYTSVAVCRCLSACVSCCWLYARLLLLYAWQHVWVRACVH